MRQAFQLGGTKEFALLCRVNISQYIRRILAAVDNYMVCKATSPSILDTDIPRDCKPGNTSTTIEPRCVSMHDVPASGVICPYGTEASTHPWHEAGDHSGQESDEMPEVDLCKLPGNLWSCNHLIKGRGTL